MLTRLITAGSALALLTLAASTTARAEDRQQRLASLRKLFYAPGTRDIKGTDNLASLLRLGSSLTCTSVQYPEFGRDPGPKNWKLSFQRRFGIYTETFGTFAFVFDEKGSMQVHRLSPYAGDRHTLARIQSPEGYFFDMIVSGAVRATADGRLISEGLYAGTNAGPPSKRFPGARVLGYTICE